MKYSITNTEIISTKGRSESAYDENIPFSLFDTCHISYYEFIHNGEKKVIEHKRIDRTLSDNFARIARLLSPLGYDTDNRYQRTERDIIKLNCDYGFYADGMPNIVINFNTFHNNLYEIEVGYGRNLGFLDIKNYETDIIQILKDWAKVNNNTKLLRDIKLSLLID